MFIKCFKYHGCGNDFIIINHNKNINYSEFTKKVCNRYIGIGADTLIVVDDKKEPSVRFFNADGTEAPMCGNGIRCVARFLNDEYQRSEKVYTIKTLSGDRIVFCEDGLYKINMGKPDYSCAKLSINSEKKEFFEEMMPYDGKEIEVNAVYMTTHHLVIIVENFDSIDNMGKYFCENKIFEKKINVNFVRVINENEVKIKTYERGVGWTKACGSGTCAVFSVLNRKKIISNEMIANYEYGKLIISKENNEIYMKGPAVQVAKDILFLYNK